MTQKLKIITRLLTGSFVPFLEPFWDEREYEAVRVWLKGASFHDSFEQLQESLEGLFYPDSTIVFLNSGRSAIQVALESMGIEAGSEVILPTFSCTGVVMPVLQAGMRPVLVDVDEEFNINFDSVLEVDSSRVKAIIVPHLSGCWAKNLEKILEWAQSQKIYVIEDCAQAFGLEKEGRVAGSFGDAAIFSTGGGKTIFGPGGGILIARHPEISRRLRARDIPAEQRGVVTERIRNFAKNYCGPRSVRGRRILLDIIKGKTERFIEGNKKRQKTLKNFVFEVYRMSDMEAQLNVYQLPKLGDIIKERRSNANMWKDKLSKMSIDKISYLPDQFNIYTKMLVYFKGDSSGNKSKTLRYLLWSLGIETESSYIPLHLRDPFRELKTSSMNNVEKKWKSAFSLPVRPGFEDIKVKDL